MTEICRIRSSSLAESLAGSSVGSGRFKPPSWWWMWKSSVPFSSHCCLQRTRGMSSELPEISKEDQDKKTKDELSKLHTHATLPGSANDFKWFSMLMDIIMKSFFFLWQNTTITQLQYSVCRAFLWPREDKKLSSWIEVNRQKMSSTAALEPSDVAAPRIKY